MPLKNQSIILSKWIHKHSRDEKVIIDFINSMHPELDGIQGELSHGKDFHVWVRQGGKNQKRFELKFTGQWTSSTSQNVETMLEAKTIKLLSFSMGSPPVLW